MVRAHHLAVEGLALLGERRDDAADARPGWSILVVGARERDELVDVRALGEHAARQVPDFGEGRVEQLEPPVGREHRDAFLEAVERLALHVDEGVVLALERQPLGLVDEQVGHAAVGPLLGHDVQHAAVGQVPPVLLRGGLAVTGQHLRLPLGIVDDLRQPPELAQAVEHGAVRGRVLSHSGSSFHSVA